MPHAPLSATPPPIVWTLGSHIATLLGNDLEPAVRSAVGPSNRLPEVAFPEHGTCPIDVEVQVTEGNGLEVALAFDRRCLGQPVAERLVDSFLWTLETLGRPERLTVGDITVVAPQDRERIVVEWNDTDGPFPVDQLLHEPFETMATSQPEAIAIEAESRRGVVRRAGKHARTASLTSCANTAWQVPVVFVARVCLDRKIDLIVALFAVSKTGAAYLPLDPRYPHSRLSLMLEDSASTVVVASPRHRHLGAGRVDTAVARHELTFRAATSPGRLSRVAKASDICWLRDVHLGQHRATERRAAFSSRCSEHARLRATRDVRRGPWRSTSVRELIRVRSVCVRPLWHAGSGCDRRPC